MAVLFLVNVRRCSAVIVALLLAACGPSAGSSPEQGLATVWNAGPPLPSPVTNNAVAAVEVGGTVAVFSLLGLDSTKLWRGVTNVAYRWDVGSDLWRIRRGAKWRGGHMPVTSIVLTCFVTKISRSVNFIGK